MTDRHPLFAGIGGHHTPKRSRTDEWLTPRHVLEALGPFDLDPCAPVKRPWAMARQHYTIADDGLTRRWAGRVWLNPPYGRVLGRWLARMAEHDRGISLIFARTDTAAFFASVWKQCTALLFLRGRLNFLDTDGKPRLTKKGRPANSGAPSVLCAYGSSDAGVLASCGLDGAFVALRLPRGIVLSCLSLTDNDACGRTWLDVIVQCCTKQRGPVALADLYRELAGHPKARANPNYRAKIRQVLQHGPFRRVARGQWCAA